MKKNLLNAATVLITCFLFLGICQAQNNARLLGKVNDEEGTSLLSATVVILNTKDSSLVDFGMTNNEGEFIFNGLKAGDYLLQVSYLGYVQFSQALKITEEKKNYIMEDITLSPASTQMEEVIIEGERIPMMMKKDTLIYNADAFKIQPNDVVEDLLRQLPGIEVEQDGVIKAQGEEVKQVLVDGKEFFGKDPKIATKNLPADAVKNVKVYDKKSDKAEFSGVDDGEREKTIDLELKEDKKKGTFGTVAAGYGSNDRFKGRISLNRFSGKMQISGLGNINNINEQGFTWGEVRGFNSAGAWTSLPISRGMSDGFMETAAGGINFNYVFDPETDLSLSYFVNSVDANSKKIIMRENFLEEGSYITEEESEQIASSSNHTLNFRIKHDIDSTQDIQFSSNIVFIENKNLTNSNSIIFEQDNSIENELDSEYESESNNNTIAGDLMYRKKLGATGKSSFALSTRLNKIDNTSDAHLMSDNDFYPDDPLLGYAEMIAQNHLQNNDQINYSVYASYISPLGPKNFMELRYNRQNYNDDIVREVYDEMQGMRMFNDSLSSRYVRDYYYDRFSVAWHLNTEKSQLTMETSVQNSKLLGNIISEDVIINNDVFRVLPRISWRHEFAQAHHMNLRYSTSVREPRLTQLQPITDNTDPQNIVIGNPDLVPEYGHNVNLYYNKYDQFNFDNFFAYLNMSYTKNSITTQTIKEPGRQVRQFVNVDYAINMYGTLSYSAPIRTLNIKYDIRTKGGIQNGPIFINGEENIRNNYNVDVRAIIENRKKEFINWRLGGSWEYNISRYSENSSQDQVYINKNIFSDVIYNYKKLFSISTGINIDFYSEQRYSDGEVVPIWTASFSKYFLKDQKAELKISAFDILNQNLGINRVSSLNYVENSEELSLSRYFMISFIYAIKN